MEKSELTKSVQKTLAIIFILVIFAIIIGVWPHNPTMAYTDGERCSICQATTIRWTYNSKVHGYYCDYCADWYGETSHENVPADYIKTEIYMTHTTYYVCTEEECDYKTEVTENCELVNFTNIDSEKHEAQCKNCRDIYELSHVYEDKNGKCIQCEKEDANSEIEISSTKYNINGTYILKIQPSTKVSDIKSNIITNATEINVYSNDENISNDTIIATGNTIEFKNGSITKTFTVIVKGDVNSDGVADFKDLVKINKARLNKITLEEIYFLAADVSEDEGLDLKDLTKINRFRLNKITEL